MWNLQPSHMEKGSEDHENQFVGFFVKYGNV